ncbi:MAG: polysaccharide deacetylase family protein [Coriobacteriales bacterium]|nr:polysaccharide deacetylase family protein [Coriobacteriales bacterium]
MYGIAAVIVAAAVLAVVTGMQRPIEVKVDGAQISVDRGTTVSQLIRRKVFTAPHGNLVTVEGKIARIGGGLAPSYLRNGQPVEPTQVVYAGDDLASRIGANRTEEIIAKKKKVPRSTKERGSGPIAKTVRAGRDGILELRVGAISGKVVSRTWVRKPVAAIVEYRRLTSKDKVVALTFDDGPWPKTTDQVLRILDKYDIKATFFMIGARARVMPGMARRVARKGHTVANHTLSHRLLGREKSLTVIKNQINGGQVAIERATGVDAEWFRPPGGSIDTRSKKAVRQAGLQVVMWDVDSNDWRKPGSAAIANNVIKNSSPGAVILMHDGGGDRSQTVAALPKIIKGLKKRGYSFVTLDDMK